MRGDAAPATPAGRLYTGVLYAALDIATLPPGAARNLVIVSAQFGALRAADRIPAYKREMAAAHWRDGLGAPLEPQARSSGKPTRQSGGGAEKVPKCCLVLGFSSGAAIFGALPIVPDPGGVMQGCRVRRCPCAPSPAAP